MISHDHRNRFAAVSLSPSHHADITLIPFSFIPWSQAELTREIIMNDFEEQVELGLDQRSGLVGKMCRFDPFK